MQQQGYDLASDSEGDGEGTSWALHGGMGTSHGFALPAHPLRAYVMCAACALVLNAPAHAIVLHVS